jgi:hypothetical protein
MILNLLPKDLRDILQKHGIEDDSLKESCNDLIIECESFKQAAKLAFELHDLALCLPDVNAETQQARVIMMDLPSIIANTAEPEDTVPEGFALGDGVTDDTV